MQVCSEGVESIYLVFTMFRAYLFLCLLGLAVQLRHLLPFLLTLGVFTLLDVKQATSEGLPS